MSICVEGKTEDAIVSLGQYILIEGDDDDNPFVAQLCKLYTDGRNITRFYAKCAYLSQTVTCVGLCNICTQIPERRPQ